MPLADDGGGRRGSHRGRRGFSLEGKDGAFGYVPSNALMTIGISGYFIGAHVANKHYGRERRPFLKRRPERSNSHRRQVAHSLYLAHTKGDHHGQSGYRRAV
jgi:hypothetical protein